MYTLISHFSFEFGLCGYRGTWFQLRIYRLNLTSGFWVLASGSLAMLAWRVFLEEKLKYLFREKKSQIHDKSKQTMNQRVQFYIYFVTLNDLDHVTSSSSFLWSRVARVHLWFQIFNPQNISKLIACQREKWKGWIFSLISVFDVDRREFFVLIPIGQRGY